MKHECTANDTINLRIVGGLLAVGALLVAGSVGLLFLGKPIPETLLVMAGNIFAGLIGYLSRGPEPHRASGSAVTASSVETVNVEGDSTPESGHSPESEEH